MLLAAVGKFFRWLKKPALIIGQWLLPITIISLYEQYWKITLKLRRASHPLEKIAILFNNRYLVHLIIILIALGVATANLLAYENREDYGQNSLINKIAGVAEDSITEDTAVADYRVYSYLGANSQLQNELFTEASKEEPNGNEPRVNLSADQLALIKPEIISDSNAEPGQRGIIKYTVADGDSLYNLANRFDISLNTILWANNLSLNSYLKPGQILIIPPISGVLHKIVRGDTLSKIAIKYGAEEEKIKQANSWDNNSLLVIGETIIVPGGKIIYTPKPRAAIPAIAAGQRTPTNEPLIAPDVGEKMYWPSSCRRITQYSRGWRHPGIDIACSWGTPIRAADGGRVTRVQYGRTGYGYNLIIDHGNGLQTHYSHLSEIDVENGQYVEKGEIIGKEGSTGRSTGPHLDFEVIINGVKVNPLNYVR